MEHIVLISKDILSLRYLPTYGNTYWKTPNIDELVSKGTVFKRHYTAAPSTAMSFISMFTGKYPYQTGNSEYKEVNQFTGTTLFDELDKKGYICHLVWSKNYIQMAERYSKCYGKNTIHHNKLAFNEYVGPHILGFPRELPRYDEETEETYALLMDEIDTIDKSSPVFLWVHLPHVFKGRTGYGDDMDLLDRFVGDIRSRFGDNIYITADHGCNDGKDGKTGYGFDVYESSIHIPLITPRIQGKETVETPTSNTDLSKIILDGIVPENEYVLSDTAYYQQPHRKLAIIKDNYKFVYDKAKKKKSLYDVIYDECENIDLNKDIMPDKDRNRKVVTSQVLFYPYRDKAKQAYAELDKIFEDIWDNGNFFINQKNKYINKLKHIYGQLQSIHKKRRKNK